MLNKLHYFISTSVATLLADNSIYAVSSARYDEYDILLKKHKALLSTLPMTPYNAFYIKELGRDFFFYLTVPPEEILENPTNKLIYIIRATLLEAIVNTPAFQSTYKKIHYDSEQAFIYSTMLISAISKVNTLLDDVEEIEKDIYNLLKFNKLDLRTLFSEQYTSIEPYPKKLASYQRKLAKSYLSFFAKEPIIFENLLNQAAIDFSIFQEILRFKPDSEGRK